MAKSITYIGLDVHKDTIAVALAEADLRGEVRQHGKILNTPTALKALTVKLAGAGKDLRFCHEGGHAATAFNDNSPAWGTIAPSSLHR
jgi:transposase